MIKSIQINPKINQYNADIPATLLDPLNLSVENISISAQQLGASTFRERYGLKYAYSSGGMYKGVASTQLVITMARSGFLSFFGTAGMELEAVENSILTIRKNLEKDQVFGMNLLCYLDDPTFEMDMVSLYLKHEITCVEAAAFMSITPALVYYRLCGLTKNNEGDVYSKNRVIVKISRPEVAELFLSPPPSNIVEKLFKDGMINKSQFEMSDQIVMCDDMSVEADSAGHTDRGIASVLLPAIKRIRQKLNLKYNYRQPIHVGLAGGIGTPEAAISAFMMGAEYIVTGSINQCTVEAGTSDGVKNLLQDIDIQDTEYAPAGDMFEMGSTVQVLKKGVFFPARANKLYSLYNQYESIDEIPEKIKNQLETKIFKKAFSQVWQEVKLYNEKKGHSSNLILAEKKPKHKMALIFKWYFYYSTKLAFLGDINYSEDFQVHTGPALGAFNQLVGGTELESWRNRHVDKIAKFIMEEAAVILSNKIHSYENS